MGGGLEEWASDFGATEHLTSDVTGMKYFVPTVGKTTVETTIVDFMVVKSYAKLDMAVKIPEEKIETAILERIAHVPSLGQNLRPAKLVKQNFRQEYRDRRGIRTASVLVRTQDTFTPGARGFTWWRRNVQ